MSSKSANLKRQGLWRRLAPASWSIVRRLTVSYTAAATATLLVVIGLLYWVVGRSLRDAQTAFLMDEITKLTSLLQKQGESVDPKKLQAALEGEARRRSKYYARILDTTGEILVQSAPMSRTLPPPVGFPRIKPGEAPVVLTRRWQAPNGRYFLLGAGRGRPSDDAQRQPLLQVALDISEDEATLRQYRQWFALALFISSISSALAAYGIAHRSLRPVRDITRAAQRITASQLDARVNPARWPGELTALATEFDRMLGRLGDSFVRLQQFSADIAHELRTPVNNLRGEAEVALTRTRTAEEYRQVIESSLEECARLSQIIDSLLFLARAENADTRLQRKSFDVLKEIRSVIEFYEPLSEELQVSLSCPQCVPGGPASVPLSADAVLFRRALSNLISNALHHTPRGGQVEVAAQTTDGAVAISVRDTGCGIAPQHQERIFDRFYRVDPARSRHTHGTGLGLPIVKSIVNLHNGKVDVQSEPGKGSTFTMYFPSSANGEPAAEQNSDARLTG